MTEITVSGMSSADIPAVSKLERLCFSDPWSSEAISTLVLSPERSDSFRQLTFAAHIGSRLAGYAIVYLVAGEGQLERIAASPEFRRMGVGKALLGAVMDEMRELGAGRITLEVRESNAAARALYESSGFVTDGIRRRFYRDPTEDAVLMSAEIK
ncbi:MAG: ribosomal protein S18-alanine N-acetyltransferase [Clostridiales bacterium]|nr:ribosomal protein S18-alanine N-acetyltransferase [Clostridiales bacterium]